MDYCLGLGLGLSGLEDEETANQLISVLQNLFPHLALKIIGNIYSMYFLIFLRTIYFFLLKFSRELDIIYVSICLSPWEWDV